MNADPQLLAAAFAAQQVVLGLVFLLAGLSKMLGGRMMVMFDHLHVPQAMRVVTGAIELAVALGLFLGLRDPSAAVIAAVSACPLLLGAAIASAVRPAPRESWLSTGLIFFLCVQVIYVHWTR